MNNFERINSSVSCIDIALDHGMKLKKSGAEYICDSYRAPQDNPYDYNNLNRNSGNYLHIDPHSNTWHDLVLDIGGGPVQFQIYFEHEDFDVTDSSIYNQAIHELAKKYGVELEVNRNTRQATKHQNDTIDSWINNLMTHDSALDYITKRLNFNSKQEALEFCDKYKLGVTYYYGCNRIVIPYLNEYGEAIYFQARALDEDVNPKYAYAKRSEWGERPKVWGINTFNSKRPLVICEGIFDALSLLKENYSVISPLSIAFKDDATNILIKYARKANFQGRDVIIIFDNDFKPGVQKNEGQDRARALAIDFFENNINFKVAATPNSIKDINEYYQERKELDSLISGATPGLDYLCNALTPNDLKELVKKHVRSQELEYSLEQLLDTAELNGNFPPALIKSLKKLLKTVPKDNIVANEFVKKYNTIFKSNDGFYLYESGKWTKKYEEEIHNLIDSLLGKFSTSAKLANITKLIAAKTVSRIEFNKLPLMSFKNGTLELETGNFRESRPEDYITGQCPYEYDPEAKCPKWDEYLSFTLGDDEDGREKIRVMKQFCGYILIPDCRYKKCLFLYGPTANNGKTVFLETIKKLFDPGLVTSVFLEQLGQDFSRISLQHSYVNIANENESQKKFDGNVDYWKSIVSGDTINACYKHKDFITFNSRAKLMFSDNSMPRSSDKTQAVADRWIFIEFNKRFSTDPNLRPGEFRANPHLMQELESELPGIFNWMYEGYKDLIENDGFSIPDSSIKLNQEVCENNDPVLAFVNHLIFDPEEFDGTTPFYLNFTGNEYDGNDIRRRFVEFAEDNGYSSRPGDKTIKRYFTEALNRAYPGMWELVSKRKNGSRWVIHRVEPVFDDPDFTEIEVDPITGDPI